MAHSLLPRTEVSTTQSSIRAAQDHRRLKAWLRPTRGLKPHRSAQILATGHAFGQNLRRGHYKIATKVPSRHRLRVAFDDLALAI